MENGNRWELKFKFYVFIFLHNFEPSKSNQIKSNLQITQKMF